MEIVALVAIDLFVGSDVCFARLLDLMSSLGVVALIDADE